MFTVIILSKRSSDLLKDYRFLFKPFVDNESIAFCDWNEFGADITSSVPDLYNIVKGKKEWRAIVLNTDSIYDFASSVRPDRDNPFDYSGSDKESLPHESPIPLIRLCHMLGGYPSAPVKEFEKGFEYIGKNGKTVRVKESELTEDQVHQLAIDYPESLKQVYIEKPESVEYGLLQEQMVDKYYFADIRPSEIQLIATKRKTDSNEKAKIVDSWKNYLEMTSSAFWERNKYPNICRFLYYSITNNDNSLFPKELTELWLSVLTMAINHISASSLQAYRLYRLRVDVSTKELAKILNLHLNRMNSAYGFVKQQLRLKPEYTFDEEEELISRQIIPVLIEKNDDSELYIDFGAVGLSRDYPQDEVSYWTNQIKFHKDNLDKYIKSPRRSIDKAATMLKTKSMGFTGERYELDRFQLDDLNEAMEDLTTKIFASGIENLLDRRKINDEIEQVDKAVKKEVGFRMRRKHVLAYGGFALLMAFAGFIPYLLDALFDPFGKMIPSFFLVAVVLSVVAGGGLVSLFIQRKKVIDVMKQYNDVMRRVANAIRSYANKFEGFFTDICTYMKARSIIDGIDIRKESFLSNFSIMNVHKQALTSAMDRDNEWIASYGIKRVDELIPIVSSFFNSSIVPIENPLYYFEMNADEYDIPVNSTGDMVTSPYKFVEKLWVEREDIFDEEEVEQ